MTWKQVNPDSMLFLLLVYLLSRCLPVFYSVILSAISCISPDNSEVYCHHSQNCDHHNGFIIKIFSLLPVIT